MTSSQFLISALRAMLEVFMLSLLAQGLLYMLLNTRRSSNAIYRLFALLTAAPRRWSAYLLPRLTPRPIIAGFALAIAFALWIFLAFVRKSID